MNKKTVLFILALLLLFCSNNSNDEQIDVTTAQTVGKAFLIASTTTFLNSIRVTVQAATLSVVNTSQGISTQKIIINK